MKKNHKETDERIKPKMELNSVSALSPQNEALYETGKEMLKNSLNTARDFCKFMTNVSIGAILIYLGLLKFILPENIPLTLNKLILSAIPPLFFLVSAIIFIIGFFFFPQVDYFSLEIVEEIKQAYEKTLTRMKTFANWGIFLFLIGSVLAIISIIINLK